MTTLSYLFNYAILGDGDQAAGYHWVNLVLHMVNVLLVFAVGRRLLGRLGPAALLAALWAVHPASTESVTNIVGRSDLLAAMATLGGFLMYLKSADGGPVAYRLAGGTGDGDGGRRLVEGKRGDDRGGDRALRAGLAGAAAVVRFSVRFGGDGHTDRRDAAPARRGVGRIAAGGVSFHG